jgi:hypothetical protein
MGANAQHPAPLLPGCVSVSEESQSRLCWSNPRRDTICPIVLHADDTPARCWPLEAGKTKTGGLRTYVRDERAATCQLLPA